MLPLPSKCPICGGEVIITKLSCRECEVTFEGRFSAGPFASLSPEQLKFVEIFIRHEGKITHMEDDLGLSYPTLRNRLHEIIRALGYEPGGEIQMGLSDSERQNILEDLDHGNITIEDAMRMLQEGEA